MIKKIFTTLCFGLSAVVVLAQQDPRFSQNMFNKLATNPGYAGSSGAICGNVLVRQQWSGFISGGTGIPKTAVISVDAPVKAIYGGAGLTILSDELGGNLKTLYAKLAYSYRLAVGPGTLGCGIELGSLSKSVNANWVFIDPNDNTIPPSNQKVGGTNFDMGLGLYYNIPNMLYFGISTAHLTAPDVKKFEYSTRRHYYFTGGYEFNNIDPKLSIRPSIFGKTDGTTFQADINCNVFYNNMVWGGLTYRFKESVVPMVGYQGKAGKGSYKIGYSYDVTTSSIKKQGRYVNTHEIMFGYCYVITPKVNVTRYKNVRFL